MSDQPQSAPMSSTLAKLSSKQKVIKLLDFGIKSAALLFQLGFYIIVFYHTFNQADLGSIDFVVFYTAGEVARSEGFEYTYDIERKIDIVEAIEIGEMGSEIAINFYHPPILLPIYYVIAKYSYETAYLLLLSLNLVCWIIFLFLTRKLLSTEDRDNKNHLFWIVILIGLFYPVYISLLRGQDTIVLLVGVILWVYGLLHEREIPGGFGLSLILIRPQIALALILITFFYRRKIFWYFCGFGLILAIYSLILVKWEGVLGYLEMILFSAGTVGPPMYQIGMLNLLGLLLRTFPAVNPQVFQSLAWIIYGMMIVGLCILWYLRREQQNWYLVGITVLLILVFSPHLHWHDLSLLVFPLLALALGKSTRLPKVLVPYLIAGSSIILIVSLFLSTQAYYSMPYFIVFGLFLMNLFLDRDQRNDFNLPLPVLQAKP